MARKELTFTATTGRDKGKKFLITEMSARAGHAWATRALLALMSSGVEIDEDIASKGLAGLATVAMGAIGKLPAAQVAPLLDELLDCVLSIQERANRKWMDDDFEEIATIFELQKAVFGLHIEPFISGGPLTSALPMEPEQAA
jgi:hypothetical protein